MFKAYFFAILSVLPAFLLAAAPALAQTCTPGSGVICSPIKGDICSLIKGLLDSFMIIGAPIAVVFVIIAGWKFIWAQGNKEQLKSAKENLLWTLVGIAIFFGAIVITRVIFNTINQFLSSGSSITCTI